LNVCLLFDAPQDILVVDCILELARIWQPHCQDKQYAHIETYIVIWRSHIQLYLHKVFTILTTMPMYQVTITQRIIVI
jgi:hypothetical protein